MRNDRREGPGRGLVLALVVAAMQALACLAASVALAAPPPPFISQFGTCIREADCGPAGLVSVPRGIAVNSTTGDVYVADQGNSRVSEFSPWGVFIRAWGWGVRDGAAELQTCTGETGCQEGLRGSGAGEFDRGVQGVALDSAGDVFIVDKNNHRVQKFDPEGRFLLTFGGGVDQGPHHPGDVCTAAFIAEGDTCGAGTLGTAAGQFGGAGQENEFPYSSYIAVGPGDKVYVGDHERIQRFDTSGAYVESLPLPGKTVMALAVAPSGDIYAAFADEKVIPRPVPGVVELSPAGATLGTLPVQEPWALATDQAADLYVIDGEGELIGRVLEVRKFTPTGVEVPNFTFSDSLVESTGIATSSACGIEGEDLFISNFYETYHPVGYFVRLYGPTPNTAICPPPKVSPAIVAQYATSVDDGTATLKAEIDPRFWPDTTYYVQYGTGRCSEGGCDQEQPLAPGSQLSTTTTSQVLPTNVVLENLQPGTTYHYRFVASSSGGGPVRGVGGEVGKDGAEGTFTTFPSPVTAKADCPNQGLRVGPSASLSDCRAYELVSPIEKNGGDIEAPESVTLGAFSGQYYPARIDQSAPDGERVTYSTARAFGDSQSAPWSSQYVAERSASSGWSSRSLNPPFSNVSIYGSRDQEIPFMAFSEDLCSAWLQQESTRTLTPNAPEGVPNVYRRSNCGVSSYELLTTSSPPGVQPGEEYLPLDEEYLPKVQGWTPSGDHSFVRANGTLTTDAAPGYEYQLYETSEDGELRLVSVLPNGTASSKESSLGTLASGKDDFHNDSVTHAVAANGSRIFWSGNENTIYLRVNPLAEQSADGKCDEHERACTLRISAPGSEFWAADPEGSRLIYQTSENLYEAQLEEAGETLSAQTRVIATGVKGVLGTSEDLKRVYLVSSVVLSPGAKNERGAEAVSGKPNLYLYEAGESPHLTFIATASELDVGNSISLDNFHSSLRLARVSTDGGEAVFASDADLTGYDNTDVNSGKADYEVYLYEADGELGYLRCISCNPTGARPDGVDAGNVNAQQYWVAAEIPGWSYSQYPSRVLSANGSVLFFESYDALLLGDTNGVRDVYEWERASDQQDCDELGANLYVASAGGCLSLVSTGESPQPSEFIDASRDGHDVFITTNQSLVPEDRGLVDLYDARVDGGFASKPPVSVCEGEACQNPPSPPNDATPASAVFDGPGDFVSTLAPPAPKVASQERKTASRAQALARALRACAKKARTKRKGCQAAARRRYGAKQASRAKRSTQGR